MSSMNKKQLEEIAKKLAEQASLQEKLNNSVSAYAEELKKVAEIQSNIKHISDQQAKIIEDEKNNTVLLAKLKKDIGKGTNAEISARIKEIKTLKKKIKLQRESIEYSKHALSILKEENDEIVEALGNVNKMNLAFNSVNDSLGAVPSLIKRGYGKLKGTGVFDMDKSIRMAALEMGKAENSSTGFGKNIGNAADNTAMMGIHIKDLAKMQASYSTELGRSVVLSQSGLEAMGEIAAGTMLGVEGTASLVAEMDRFNISAEDTRDIIEETVNMAEKMGINSTKVLKTLQNNLKMANKYHFKGGVQGMVKMAAQAAKFNMSMETTAGLADKLFDIEGAVEMSAQLNTMGGEWAKLGDPFKLMYQARNDMEGLQTSIIDATAGMADFNSTTGEFSFSGLELHRMRELEKITGIAAEEMAEMAKNKAKFAKISGELGFSIAGDKDMKEFIENSAVFNKDTKKFEIALEGGKKIIPIDELNSTHRKMMETEAKNLKKRAEESQTFDDTLQNTIQMFKQALLPILDALNKQLPAIQNMIKTLVKDGWISKIKSFAKTVGDIVGNVLGFLMEWPKTTATVLTTIVGGKLLFSSAKWIYNGIQMGKGFMSVIGTGGAGGSIMDGLFGGKGGKGTKGGFGRTASKIGIKTIGKTGTKMLGGAMSLGSLGGGLVGGMLGGMGSEALGNQDTMGGDIGGGIGGVIGGALGTLLGPVGTIIGAGLGSAAGKMIGDWISTPEAGIEQGSTSLSDGVIMNGKITPFDKKDDVLKFQKTGGAIDKAVATGGAGMSNIAGTTKIHISFDELKVSSDGNVGTIDLSRDSSFMRELATKLKQSINETANGGVLNPNPSTN